MEYDRPSDTIGGKKDMSRFTCLLILLLLATMLLMSGEANAGEEIFSYQGSLRDSTGGTQQGTADIEFCIYDTPSKAAIGPAGALWCETHPGIKIGPDGIFTAELGSINQLADTLFQHQLWLQVTVNGEAATPLTKLTRTPYSIVTNKVIGDFISRPGGLRVYNPSDSSKWADVSSLGLTFPADTFNYAIASCGGWTPATAGIPYTISPGNGVITATNLNPSDSAIFYAPVHLDDSVRVIGLVAYAYDPDALQDMSFTFGSRSGTVSFPIATVNTSSLSLGIWGNVENTNFTYTIRNVYGRAYYLEVRARGEANTWGNVFLICTRNRIP
jgi:hypothetical protein